MLWILLLYSCSVISLLWRCHFRIIKKVVKVYAFWNKTNVMCRWIRWSLHNHLNLFYGKIVVSHFYNLCCFKKKGISGHLRVEYPKMLHFKKKKGKYTAREKMAFKKIWTFSCFMSFMVIIIIVYSLLLSFKKVTCIFFCGCLVWMNWALSLQS